MERLNETSPQQATGYQHGQDTERSRSTLREIAPCKGLTIGQLAQATGVSAKIIRYYEQIGVLPAPSRSAAGYRQYARGDVHRLLFVRRARALGLSLAALKTLVAELDGGAGPAIRPRLYTLVTEQLHAVQRRIAEFQLLEQQLVQVLQRLESAASTPHTQRRIISQPWSWCRPLSVSSRPCPACRQCSPPWRRTWPM